MVSQLSSDRNVRTVFTMIALHNTVFSRVFTARRGAGVDTTSYGVRHGAEARWSVDSARADQRHPAQMSR